MRDGAFGEAEAKNEVVKVRNADDENTSVRSETSANIPIYIGDKLKALFEEVVNQPVPDRLLDLLKRLETDVGDD